MAHLDDDVIIVMFATIVKHLLVGDPNQNSSISQPIQSSIEFAKVLHVFQVWSKLKLLKNFSKMLELAFKAKKCLKK